MTRYTVVWDDDVEVAFINAWLATDSNTRAALTFIANWIDTNLAEDADLKGRARRELSARTIDVPLLNTNARVLVTYRVLPEDRLVRVVQLALNIR